MSDNDPIEEAYREKLRSLAATLDEYLNEGREPQGVDGARAHGETGFILIAFDFGTTGRTNYVSNANREDCIALLNKLTEHLDRKGRHLSS